MQTINHLVRAHIILLLAAVTIFTGCTPPGPRALLEGKELIDKGQYAAAVEELRLATKLMGTNALAWNYLGLACHHSGASAEAAQAYQRALVLDRDLSEAHFNLGCLWLEENRLEGAKAEFLAYTLRRANSVEGPAKLGMVQLQLREISDAEKSFADVRQDTPSASFVSRIFGYDNFSLSREAIAYIGFAGTLAPGEADQPIAICRESLLVNGQYTCATGRMITNHEVVAGLESGGWTDFNQESACLTGTNAETVRSLICGGGNPEPILLGQPVAVNGGYIQNAHGLLRDCWQAFTGGTQLWTLTLPVIECPGNNVDSCATMVGAVTINVVWITPWEDDPSYSNAPWQMENPRTGTTWSSNNPNGQVRWNSFVQSFNLQAPHAPAVRPHRPHRSPRGLNPRAPSGNSGSTCHGAPGL